MPRLARVQFVLSSALPIALAVCMISSSSAQTLTVLHTFTGGMDGANPYTGLTIDATGRLYGTASKGGAGYGTVFELRDSGSGWTFAPLYSFAGSADGATPLDGITIGANGILYGSTYAGGTGQCVGGCGTIFNLRPPAGTCNRALCLWTKTVLHVFQRSFLGEGAHPVGKVVFDPSGNLYGVTIAGGPQDEGTVYELLPSNGSWTENILHLFSGDDGPPWPGVVFDHAGNLYGTTGSVYELTPTGSGWVESILHRFYPITDGADPVGVIVDGAGDLYGGTATAGQYGSGTIFELSPSNGGWTFSVLVQVPGSYGCGVSGPLVMDAANNLYGATTCGRAGMVFKLSPSGGTWTFTDLYDFTGGSDGQTPNGGLVIDANGNLYGTTQEGGSGCYPYGCGVVWKLTP